MTSLIDEILQVFIVFSVRNVHWSERVLPILSRHWILLHPKETSLSSLQVLLLALVILLLILKVWSYFLFIVTESVQSIVITGNCQCILIFGLRSLQRSLQLHLSCGLFVSTRYCCVTLVDAVNLNGLLDRIKLGILLRFLIRCFRSVWALIDHYIVSDIDVDIRSRSVSSK